MRYTASRGVKRGLFSLFVCISVMLLLGCSENSPSSEGSSTETGAIALNIIMGDTQWDDGGSVISRAMSDECGTATPYAISGVGATVYSDPAVTGSWACSAGGGTLSNVTPGNNLRLVIIGYNASEFGNITLYSGETYVTVVAGQTTPSNIVAETFSVDKFYPGQAATDVAPNNITFEWGSVIGADAYRIQVADRLDFSDPGIVLFINEVTTNTSFTHDSSLAEDTTYYWCVFPIDIAGDSAYDTAWDFTTGTGGDNYEENDTKEAAFDLSAWDGLNLLYLDGYGAVTPSDPDFYQITIPYDEAVIEISCTFASQLGDIDIELQDAAGMILASSVTPDNNEYISYPHASGPSTTYYIKVYRYDPDAAPNQYDLIWYARPTAPLDVNLAPYFYDWGDPDLDVFFRLSDNTLTWGDSLDLRFAVINDGSEDIPSETGIWVRLLLSADNVITESDYELEYRVFGYGLLSGYYLSQMQGFGWQVTLPTFAERPPGFPVSGQFYIGMVIDPENLLIETDEYDNSNVGQEWDSAPLNISP